MQHPVSKAQVCGYCRGQCCLSCTLASISCSALRRGQQTQHATPAQFQSASKSLQQRTADRLQRAAITAPAAHRKHAAYERNLKLGVSLLKQSYWAAPSAAQTSTSYYKGLRPSGYTWRSFVLRLGCRQRLVAAAHIQAAWRGYAIRKAMQVSRTARSFAHVCWCLLIPNTYYAGCIHTALLVPSCHLMKDVVCSVRVIACWEKHVMHTDNMHMQAANSCEAPLPLSLCWSSHSINQ